MLAILFNMTEMQINLNHLQGSGSSRYHINLIHAILKCKKHLLNNEYELHWM